MPFSFENFPQAPNDEQKNVERLLSRVLEQLGIDAEIKIEEIQEADSVTKAFRIILSRRGAANCEVVLVTDWDDTLERYTERKKLYFAKLIELFLTQKPDLNKKALLNFFKLVNKTARCLPNDGTSPESYSPYLEMLVESYCLKILESRPDEFERILKIDKNELRQLIFDRVFPISITDLIGDVEKEKVENGKTVKKSYFQQLQPAVLEIDFQVIPPLVSEEIWDLFIKQMIGKNLSPEGLAKMALKNNVYWAISSFGSVSFQIEKILAGLKELQKTGQRLPDEIVVVTQGRKKPFLTKFFEQLSALGKKKNIYLDDSTSQLDLMVELKDTIKSFWAQVRGSARAKVKDALIGNPTHQAVNLEEVSLQEVVDQVFS